MNNNYYSTYKFFNEKKRRLSAFGRELEGKLEIVIWECDRADSFTKAFAREMYENYINNGEPCYHTRERVKGDRNTHFKLVAQCAKPVVINIERTDENIKNQFIRYMEENYLKAFPKWKLVGWDLLNYDSRKKLHELLQQELALDINNK